MVTYPNTQRQPFIKVKGKPLAFFNELGAAFGAGDGNFAAALGHAYLLAAVRAGKIAVGFAQGKPLLQLAELGAHTSGFLHKGNVFCIALVYVAAEHAEVRIKQQQKPDIIKDAHKQPNYQADQRRYAQKVAKSITAVPPGHKTLEPCLHLKHAILLNTGVPQKQAVALLADTPFCNMSIIIACIYG